MKRLTHSTLQKKNTVYPDINPSKKLGTILCNSSNNERQYRKQIFPFYLISFKRTESVTFRLELIPSVSFFFHSLLSYYQ